MSVGVAEAGRGQGRSDGGVEVSEEGREEEGGERREKGSRLEWRTSALQLRERCTMLPSDAIDEDWVGEPSYWKLRLRKRDEGSERRAGRKGDCGRGTGQRGRL